MVISTSCKVGGPCCRSQAVTQARQGTREPFSRALSHWQSHWQSHRRCELESMQCVGALYYDVTVRHPGRQFAPCPRGPPPTIPKNDHNRKEDNSSRPPTAFSLPPSPRQNTVRKSLGFRYVALHCSSRRETAASAIPKPALDVVGTWISTVSKKTLKRRSCHPPSFSCHLIHGTALVSHRVGIRCVQIFDEGTLSL